MSGKGRKLLNTDYINQGANDIANALAEILQPDTQVDVDVTSEDFEIDEALLGFKIYIPEDFGGGNIVATPFGNDSAKTYPDTAYTKGTYLREGRFKAITTDTVTKTGLEGWY